jgi:hypothetical protein
VQGRRVAEEFQVIVLGLLRNAAVGVGWLVQQCLRLMYLVWELFQCSVVMCGSERDQLHTLISWMGRIGWNLPALESRTRGASPIAGPEDKAKSQEEGVDAGGSRNVTHAGG